MKTHIRTLWGDDKRRAWWSHENQRDALRNYLNEAGFYVLTGPGDSLEVYAIAYDEPVDVRYMRKILDIARRSWRSSIGGSHGS